MKTSKKLTGFALATAAALMLTACGDEPKGDAAGTADQAATAESGASQEAKVHCMGVNACKGQSGCATATSGCKGQNACKAQGWVEHTKAECDAAGGTVG